MEVLAINTKECKEWILYKHYARRLPSISFAYGLFDNSELCGVLTIGKPPSPPLCRGVCGEGFSDIVYELNRLVINDGMPRNSLSFFVGRVLREIGKANEMVLVSYADTSQSHVGYIYQATNWIYTGLSAKRTEWREIGKNTHSKSVCERYSLSDRKNNSRFAEIERPQKHRYVYFLGKHRKQYRMALQYDVLPYPKGETLRYDASYSPAIQGILFGGDDGPIL